MSKTAEKSSVFGLLVVFLVVLAAALVLLNYQTVRDFAVANTFTPSAELKTIESELGLTDEGVRIFRASTPSLDTKTEFNENCGVDKEAETSVLGCYVDEEIHILEITAPEFDGIIESTAAHELLHAVWGRMSESEQADLTPVLKTVLENSDEDFQETLEPYDEEMKLEEVYVRAATQIRDLPATLEKHYATIFADQDSVVGFYESYIAPFLALETTLENLSAEMDSLKAEIETLSVNYETNTQQFSEKVQEFNACAEQTNCFTLETFNNKRAELMAEKANLDQAYQILNGKIESYNQKVELYNSQVLYGQSLQNIINSNSKATNV